MPEPFVRDVNEQTWAHLRASTRGTTSSRRLRAEGAGARSRAHDRASCSRPTRSRVALEDFPRVAAPFGPSPGPPARAAERAPRRRGRDLGQARGLQLRPRVRREQDAEARVPGGRRARAGLRHARLDRRRPVESHAPGGGGRCSARPRVRARAGALGRLGRAGYETVGNILLSRIMGATSGSPAGFDIGIRPSWEEALGRSRGTEASRTPSLPGRPTIRSAASVSRAGPTRSRSRSRSSACSSTRSSSVP